MQLKANAYKYNQVTDKENNFEEDMKLFFQERKTVVGNNFLCNKGVK